MNLLEIPCAGRAVTAVVIALGLAHLPSAASGQGDTLSLTGTVVDAATGEPVPSAAVILDERPTPRFTDLSGRFVIPDVALGDHVVQFTKIGFAARGLAIRVQGADADMGPVSLQRLAARPITITGTVREEETSRPVPRAAVVVNEVTVAVTADDGTFRADAVDVYAAGNELEVHMLGYETVAQTFPVSESQSEVTAQVFLDRVPTELDPVVVESEQPPAHLREFERRRKAELGRYITAEEIERLNPPAATDILRRVPGVVVTGEALTGTNVRFFRSGGFCVEAPLIFLDGVYTPNLIIDAALAPERIAGIELYSGPASIPLEFNVPGSGLTGGTRAACGVIAFWTKAPELARARSPFELGIRYGGALGNDRAGQTRLGVHLVARLIGPLELYPAFAFTTGLEVSNRGIQSSLWFAQLAVRLHPLGNRIPWYVGSGLTLSKPSLKIENVPANDFSNAPDVDPAHTLFSGFNYQFGPARPFLEIHVLDVFAFSNPTTEMFLGLGMQF